MRGDFTSLSYQNLTETLFKVLFYTLICDPPIQALHWLCFNHKMRLFKEYGVGLKINEQGAKELMFGDKA